MMTLSKLAKLANVSVSTASKAFAGSTEVHGQTRDMIFRIAKEHGCFKKFYNAKYPRLVIAVIAPEFSSGYYAKHLSFIQQQLEQENCELCVSTTNFSAEQETALLEYYYQHANVDGIIAINTRTAPTEPYEIPVVHINPAKLQPHGISIQCSLDSALTEAISMLKEKQVTAIGFIGETRTTAKQARFRQVLEEQDMTYDEALVSISEGRFEQGGYNAMEALFAKGRLPRAIVCAYDCMAIGAMRCIFDHSLSVPKDFALLGMDDIREAAYLNPPLASISGSTAEVCRLAADAILRAINGEAVEKLLTVPPVFHLRRSFQID